MRKFKLLGLLMFLGCASTAQDVEQNGKGEEDKAPPKKSGVVKTESELSLEWCARVDGMALLYRKDGEKTFSPVVDPGCRCVVEIDDVKLFTLTNMPGKFCDFFEQKAALEDVRKSNKEMLDKFEHSM